MLKTICSVLLAFSGFCAFVSAQAPVPAPSAPPSTPASGPAASATPEPEPIAPPAVESTPPAGAAGQVTPQATPAEGVPTASTVQTVETAGSGKTARDFQGDDLATVLRLLSRQAKINLYVSDQVVGTITLRLENKTPMESIHAIAEVKGLIVDYNPTTELYTVKTPAEKAAEPTESASYTFSYAQSETMAPLLQSQLTSGIPPQIDKRTNTIFYRETKSNLGVIEKFLVKVDRPTRQVMIEARLVEVNSNPKQSYGINWGGVLGSAGSPQTYRYAASPIVKTSNGEATYDFQQDQNGQYQLSNFLRYGDTYKTPFLNNITKSFGFDNPSLGNSVFGQFAILSLPQFSATMRLLNEDNDAEFLAHPRIVTADNQEAKIEITRAQPVPQLNFNEQTATAVFSGFQDKVYGNTLAVKPSINKDNYITMSVKPKISNKVGDETFIFAGAAVSSPIIDERTLESNVLIRSGDTLAIGGLLQDETSKGSTKVPVLGDIPVLGYFFQEKLNARTKRNLLIFVTPTIIEMGEGTGLEDQVSGMRNSGEEFADPNGWRNNAKGAIRIIPTSLRQTASAYPKPGTPMAPRKVSYKTSASAREN